MTLSSSVVPLLKRCCPSNVRRLVMAVVVDAINRMRQRWTRPDVSQEYLERVVPCVDHGDASSAVVLELLRPRIAAPLLDIGPRGVFRRAQRVDGMSVAASCGHHVGAIAATRVIVPRHQMARAENAFCSAFAAAQKHLAIILSRIRFRYDGPSSELVAGLYSGRSHAVAPLSARLRCEGRMTAETIVRPDFTTVRS